MVDNGGCSHVCNVTVTDAQQGVSCSCHSGYFLAANGKDCIGKLPLVTTSTSYHYQSGELAACGECPYFCIPASGGDSVSCLCPDGYPQDPLTNGCSECYHDNL